MMFQDLAEVAASFVRESAMNTVPELGDIKLYDAPLVGAAKADDPLFEYLKRPDVVGPNHLSPKQWLEGAKTVIVYFLPFSQAVRHANRYPGPPATEWLYGRIEGEKLNVALRDFLAGWLAANGFVTMIPAQDFRFAVVDRRSNWSERHAAYVAGLGTFSLNRSLISRRGAAGRIGSLISALDVPATPRAYSKYDEHCTHCGACIKRCPAKAITEDGKDNELCSAYLDETKKLFAPRYGCGKCQTGVPCEDRIPGCRE